MKLFYAPASPFVRKVNVFAIEVGLDKQVEWLETNPWQAEDKLTSENPLSKIPTLVTDDGTVIYDSRVICEYLDSIHEGKKLIPKEGKARWQVLRLQALADGILDAGILRFREHQRVESQQSEDWDKLQKNAVERGLNYLENRFSEWSNTELNVGIITVGCVLGWLDFRFPQENWRISRPALTSWYEVFSARASMRNTVPRG